MYLELNFSFNTLSIISKSSEYKIKPYAWSSPNADDHLALHGILYKFKIIEFHCISQIFTRCFTVLFLTNRF